MELRTCPNFSVDAFYRAPGDYVAEGWEKGHLNWDHHHPKVVACQVSPQSQKCKKYKMLKNIFIIFGTFNKKKVE